MTESTAKTPGCSNSANTCLKPENILYAQTKAGVFKGRAESSVPPWLSQIRCANDLGLEHFYKILILPLL